MRVLHAGSMMQSLRGQQTAARGRRTATCPPSRPGPATSNDPLPIPGREQGDATVVTKQKRKEAGLGTSSSTPTGAERTSTYRTTARIVGAMYLAGFVVGITGIVLIQSILGAPDHLATLPANSVLLAIAAVLWLMAAAWAAAPGGRVLPLPQPH